MFWMAKVPDNNLEVYDVGDRRFTFILIANNNLTLGLTKFSSVRCFP